MRKVQTIALLISAMPGDQQTRSSPPSSEAPACHCAMLSEVMPHSMMVNGSVITSGGTPSAGGGDHLRSASMISSCAGHLPWPVPRPARRYAHRPAVVQVEQHLGHLVPAQQEYVVRVREELLAATRTRPRSRILRQMIECAQCST